MAGTAGQESVGRVSTCTGMAPESSGLATSLPPATSDECQVLPGNVYQALSVMSRRARHPNFERVVYSNLKMLGKTWH